MKNLQKNKKTNKTFIPEIKSGGFAETLQNWISDRESVCGVDELYELINGKDFNHYIDTKHYDYMLDMYKTSFEHVCEDYMRNNNKSKIDKKTLSELKTVASHFVFMMLDEIDIDDERYYDITDVIERYFDDNQIHFTISLAMTFMIEELEIPNLFKPEMEWDDAYDKMLEWYVTPEAINYQVPQKLKYSIGHIKQHLDIYMWEEFLKQEYYAAKLCGLSDDAIEEMFDSKALLYKFCSWCEGCRDSFKEN